MKYQMSLYFAFPCAAAPHGIFICFDSIVELITILTPLNLSTITGYTQDDTSGSSLTVEQLNTPLFARYQYFEAKSKQPVKSCIQIALLLQNPYQLNNAIKDYISKTAL